MISKNIVIGMKVVPIKKSVGQDFEQWKSLWFTGKKYVIVEKFVNRNGGEYHYWVCNVPGTDFVGHFKASDLVEYQE